MRFKLGHFAIVFQSNRKYGPFIEYNKFSFGKYIDIGPISFAWLK